MEIDRIDAELTYEPGVRIGLLTELAVEDDDLRPGDVLWFNPSLPEETQCLRYRLRYRRHWLDVEITGDRLKVSTYVGSPEPIKLGLKEKVYELKPGDTREFAL